MSVPTGGSPLTRPWNSRSNRAHDTILNQLLRSIRVLRILSENPHGAMVPWVLARYVV